MADEVKPQKSENKSAPSSSPVSSADPFAEIFGIIIVMVFAVSLINGLISSIRQNDLLSRGWQGLTPQGILQYHTEPVSSVGNAIGVKVVSMDQTEVHNSPNGRKVGLHHFNDRGKILQGPVDAEGFRYWYVDYETGHDGWVKENNIAYLKSEPNAIEHFIINIVLVIWWIRLFLITFSLLCIAGIAYLFVKLTKLRTNEWKMLYPISPDITAAINPQWERITNYVQSENQSDWRLAILEADIMLRGILDKLFLPGETIGDKLKAVEKSDFITIDKAWEAHKIRNQIAHGGESFILTQREAKRVIELYRSVFEEFHII